MEKKEEEQGRSNTLGDVDVFCSFLFFLFFLWLLLFPFLLSHCCGGFFLSPYLLSFSAVLTFWAPPGWCGGHRDGSLNSPAFSAFLSSLLLCFRAFSPSVSSVVLTFWAICSTQLRLCSLTARRTSRRACLLFLCCPFCSFNMLHMSLAFLFQSFCCCVFL